MVIKSNDIKNYIESYLNKIFNKKIILDVRSDYYVINREKSFKIYDFWNKKDDELLDDFADYSFKEDYIGTIFFFLSGYWEYTHNNKQDKYDRFSAVDSFSYKKGILEEPVVDILVDRIAKELRVDYKNNTNFPRAFITHDIDHLSMIYGFGFLTSVASDIIKRRDVYTVVKKIKMKFKNVDPHSLIRLVEIHEKYNTKGSFFFLPGLQYKKFSVGLGYNPRNNRKLLEKYKQNILSSNGSIGIHYDARHIKEDRMKNDMEVLEIIFEREINSGRAHYLIFDIEKSFDIYESSGLKLDTTCSYADMVGFRFGTCRPFKPYNFSEKREYEFIEVPLLVMEGSLQGKNHMNLSNDEGFEKIKEIMRKVKKYNGVFTFLWHNSSFFTRQWKDWEWVYEETIKYGQAEGFEFVNADDIINQFGGNNV